MTFPTTTTNAFLNGVTIDGASLHTAYPGTTGASEVTGGSPAYARKAIVMNTASGGSRLLNAGITWDIPACTVRYVGYLNGSTFVGYAPNGGATPKNFMAVASSDLVYAAGHGYPADQKIVFIYGTPPAPLVQGTTYFVRGPATDTFQVGATAGGAAMDLTGASSAGCWVCAITEDVYWSQDTHSLTSTTLTVPV